MVDSLGSHCRHADAMLTTGREGGFRKYCQSCSLLTRKYETAAGAKSAFMVMAAREKQRLGAKLTPTDEVVLAYGYTSSVCGQNLL